MPVHLFAVIVLYRVRIEACVSYADLLRAARLLDPRAAKLSILLYDNSPAPQDPGELTAGSVYHHAARNEGVAGAYNDALRLALAQGCDWMVTLDQDTRLPERFLTDLVAAAGALAGDAKVAAIVPQVFSGDRMISPHFYVAGAWPRYLPAGYGGRAGRPLFAINSASMLRVGILQAVGGYDPAFWLDASDHVLFARLARAGHGVYVLGSLRVQQSLSHLDRERPMSLARMGNILASESAFWDGEMSYGAGAMHTLVMVRHLLGMWRRGEDPALRRMVFDSIVDRLVHPRRLRLERWRRSMRDLSSSSGRRAT